LSFPPQPLAIAVDPAGSYVYAVVQPEAVLGQLSVFAIDRGNGALTPAYNVDGNTGALAAAPGASLEFVPPDAPFDSTNPYLNSFAIDPRGRLAYVTQNGSDSISIYGIEPTTGALHPIAGSPFPANSAPNILLGHMAVDPLGHTLYVTNSSTTQHLYGVAAYTLDQSTGALTLPVNGSPSAEPVPAQAIVISS
jgi:6-phosphogluconolactonase